MLTQRRTPTRIHSRTHTIHRCTHIHKHPRTTNDPGCTHLPHAPRPLWHAHMCACTRAYPPTTPRLHVASHSCTHSPYRAHTMHVAHPAPSTHPHPRTHVSSKARADGDYKSDVADPKLIRWCARENILESLTLDFYPIPDIFLKKLFFGVFSTI
jgi:hypothetical protein